jgi:CBS domain-containing protein
VQVHEKMSRNVAHCSAETRLAQAARKLWDGDCGALPVVDGRSHVIGMITDRDICMAAMTTGKPLDALRVADAMAKDVVTARTTDSLHEAELLMRAHAVRRLPVLDDQNRLIGLLSCNDLIRWVDDCSAPASRERDATHLVRTLATIGRTRRPQAVRVVIHPREAVRTHNGDVATPAAAPQPPVADRLEAAVATRVAVKTP